MKRALQGFALTAGLLMSTMRAVASPEVDYMSDIEVSEYAARMSSALELIRYYEICESHDTTCVSSEMARYGISYKDREIVKNAWSS